MKVVVSVLAIFLTLNSLCAGSPVQKHRSRTSDVTENGNNYVLADMKLRSSSSGCELAKRSCKSRWMTAVGLRRYGSGWKLSLRPTKTARVIGYGFRSSVWRDFRKCLRFPSLTSSQYRSVYQQFVCHAFYGTGGCTWDFESTRKPYKYYLNPLKKCNW